MYIYRLTNTTNGKIYIGKWTKESVATRWQEHCIAASKGSQVHFHRAIRKYGPGSFRLETLYTARTVKELNAMETFFIVLHQSHLRENGYNMTMGGDGGVPNEETRRRISTKVSLSLLGNRRSVGRIVTFKTRQKMSSSHKGHSTSEQTKQKISLALMGNKNSLSSPRPHLRLFRGGQ